VGRLHHPLAAPEIDAGSGNDVCIFDTNSNIGRDHTSGCERLIGVNSTF
jgi:hypothetical protein